MKLIYYILFITLIVGCNNNTSEEAKISKYLNSEIESISDDIRFLKIDFQQLNSIAKYSNTSKHVNLQNLDFKLNAIKNEINNKDFSMVKVDSLTKDTLISLKNGPFTKLFQIEPISSWSDSLNRKMRNLSFLRYKKMVLKNLIGGYLGCATLNDLQVQNFVSDNKEFIIFGLLDSIASNKNQIIVENAFIDDSSQQIKTKISDKGFYSEIEFLTKKKGIINWNGSYQVNTVDGKNYFIPIKGSFVKK